MRDAACRGGGLPPISSCSWSSDFAPGTVDTLPQRHTSRMLPTRAVRELRLREVKTLDKVTGVCLIPGSFPPPRSIDLMLSQASLVLGTVPWWADEAGPTRGSALRWGLGKRPLQYHKPWRKRNHLFVPWFGTTTTATTSNPGHRQKKGHLNSRTELWVPEVTAKPGRLLMATRKLLAFLGSPHSKAL